MAQFDVYRNTNKEGNRIKPFLLDVQADLLNQLSTRVVVPLMLLSKVNKPIKNLYPCFTVEGKQFVMLTNEMAGIPVSILGEKITSWSDHRNEIVAALDFLFLGF